MSRQFTLNCYCFRQIVPSKNNAAANSLSKTIQNRNVRKAEVSAQVTFVIWILECFVLYVCNVLRLFTYALCLLLFSYSDFAQIKPNEP